MKNAKARGMSELSMGILEDGWKRVRCCEEMSSAPREEARLTKPANANEGAQHQASGNPPHNNTPSLTTHPSHYNRTWEYNM